jgi:hypothetical protein
MSWSAETTLFIDDNPTFIARAEEAGLVTHLFADEDMAGLKERLTSFGLL